jgi:hypothetical protein
MALERVAHFQSLVQVLVGVARPGRRKIQRDEPDQGAHAGLVDGLGTGVREEIHVVEAGRAATDHLRHGQIHAIEAELARDVRAFGWPDVVLQPVHQRQVVGQPAQQGHRRMRVDIDQSRQHGVLRQIERLLRLEARARFSGGQHGDDAAVADRQRVILQNRVGGLDRQQPARSDKQVDVLHERKAGPKMRAPF